MTIKQQGGIFGRNPTFNDLTSNTGQFDGLITANGEVVIQGNNNAADNNTLQIKNTDTAVGSGDNIGKIEFYNSDVSDAGVAVTVKAEAASGTGLTDLVFITGKPSDSTESMRITYNHHLDMTAGGGYVKLGNGAGIDFSATSGTGTSELFDDYEEGTWTPTLLTGTATAADAVYTKIGNMVYARATLSSFSDRSTASNVVVSSLPYAPAINSSGGSMFSRYTAVATPVPNLTTGGYVTFYGNSSGNYVQLQHSNLSASASASISFNLVYRA